MLLYFRLNKSFLKIFIKRPVGVTTRKKINPITSGETIFPKSNPNLNHNRFNGVKRLELISPSKRKIKEIIIDHNLYVSLFSKGQIPIIKKI